MIHRFSGIKGSSNLVSKNPIYQPPLTKAWVRKESEVSFDLKLNHGGNSINDPLLLAGSEIISGFFFIPINPFHEDKALIKVKDGMNLPPLEGKLKYYGGVHLKLDYWSESKHSHPEVIKSYGGWIAMKIIPLRYWSPAIFKAVGENLGGLISISTKTLNLLDCSTALIAVEKK